MRDDPGRSSVVAVIDRERHIRAEADRFDEVLAGTDLTRRVPTCPDWNGLKLLQHLTGVHQFWATVIGDRLDEDGVAQFEENRAQPPDDPVRVHELRRQATADLLAALTARDPAEPAWSWFPPDQTVGFTWRMQTHEATMHRVDAELTEGLDIGPITPEVAADGIDHVLEVMWAWAPPDAERQPTGTLALQATDTGQTWLADTFRWSGKSWGQTFTDQAACVRATAGEPTASVSGTAEDLDLLVWNRATRGIARSGDPQVLKVFQAVLDDGIQ